MKLNSTAKTLSLAVLFVATVVILLVQCTNGTESHQDETQITTSTATTKPLNLSVFLDLSDRLIANGPSGQPLAPSQTERDALIVGHLIDIFVEQAVNERIVPCKNHLKVFFYPAPADPNIVSLAQCLDVDLGQVPPAQKRAQLNSMKSSFMESLGQIYSSTCQNSKWLGCDIWGFFNDRVSNYCVRQGYRNVLIVLTDGYIYYEPSKKFNVGTKTGNYVTATLLKNFDTIQLDVPDTNLNDLEVLFLEINPSTPYQSGTLKSILGAWLQGMGVTKIGIEETDLPTNTKDVIDNFLK